MLAVQKKPPRKGGIAEPRIVPSDGRSLEPRCHVTWARASAVPLRARRQAERHVGEAQQPNQTRREPRRGGGGTRSCKGPAQRAVRAEGEAANPLSGAEPRIDAERTAHVQGPQPAGRRSCRTIPSWSMIDDGRLRLLICAGDQPRWRCRFWREAVQQSPLRGAVEYER